MVHIYVIFEYLFWRSEKMCFLIIFTVTRRVIAVTTREICFRLPFKDQYYSNIFRTPRLGTCNFFLRDNCSCTTPLDAHEDVVVSEWLVISCYSLGYSTRFGSIFVPLGEQIKSRVQCTHYYCYYLLFLRRGLTPHIMERYKHSVQWYYITITMDAEFDVVFLLACAPRGPRGPDLLSLRARSKEERSAADSRGNRFPDEWVISANRTTTWTWKLGLFYDNLCLKKFNWFQLVSCSETELKIFGSSRTFLRHSVYRTSTHIFNISYLIMYKTPLIKTAH